MVEAWTSKGAALLLTVTGNSSPKIAFASLDLLNAVSRDTDWQKLALASRTPWTSPDRHDCPALFTRRLDNHYCREHAPRPIGRVILYHYSAESTTLLRGDKCVGHNETFDFGTGKNESAMGLSSTSRTCCQRYLDPTIRAARERTSRQSARLSPSSSASRQQ
jgi:hypothetical protein